MTVAPGARVRAAGDAAVVIEFGPAQDARIDGDALARVRELDRSVRASELPGLLETVPTFRSLALVLDPLVTTPGDIARQVLALLERARSGSAAQQASAATTVRHWRLPVFYGGDGGPDLEDAADSLGLAADTLVQRHAACELGVHLLGFLPGFAFLGPLDDALTLPRRREPRLRVPAGSVAIAGGLSAVYPWESPGGWHLLGQCPVPLFDARRERPAVLGAGDRVSFDPIDEPTWRALLAERVDGSLEPERFLLGERDPP